MSLFVSFDNQTLLACQLFLAASFCVAFLGMRQTHPDLKGIGSIAFSFLLGIPSIVLLLSQGFVAPLLSVVFANLLIVVSLMLFSQGVLDLIGSERSLLPFWIFSALSISLVFYFTLLHDSILPRLIVISFNVALIRGFLALEIFRVSANRRVLRLFAYSKFAFALVSLAWGLLALFRGVSPDVMQHHHVQTFTLATTILASSVTGLFTLSICHEQALTRIRAESEFDLLSGTLNRRGIEQKLEIELKRIERSDQPLAIALIDIDYFKTINDTAGHAAGDKAIRDLVTAISERLRAYDLLGRFGGDEFLLVLPQTSSAGANVVAERIGDALRALPSGNSGPSLTVSIGVTEAVVGDYSTSLLARADKALYQAKHAGRNCTRTVLHNPQPATTPESQLRIDALHPSSEQKLLQS